MVDMSVLFENDDVKLQLYKRECYYILSIKGESVDSGDTSFAYNSPFGNCQVMCIGNLHTLLFYFENSEPEFKDYGNKVEAVIREAIKYIHKRQTIVDVQSEDVDKVLKIFGEENLMWKQEYVNGTGNDMVTMMFVNAKFIKCPMENEGDDGFDDDDD